MGSVSGGNSPQPDSESEGMGLQDPLGPFQLELPMSDTKRTSMSTSRSRDIPSPERRIRRNSCPPRVMPAGMRGCGDRGCGDDGPPPRAPVPWPAAPPGPALPAPGSGGPPRCGEPRFQPRGAAPHSFRMSDLPTWSLPEQPTLAFPLLANGARVGPGLPARRRPGPAQGTRGMQPGCGQLSILASGRAEGGQNSLTARSSFPEQGT